MMSDPLGTAIRRLLRRVSAAPSAGLSDAELLERFVRSRDEAAIETLLWRHGPMVWTTCRRLLNHHADSEDCFQATFLVLCRRAGTIAKRQSVGSWLYKVAYRICLRARAGQSRRPVLAAEIGEIEAAETGTAIEQAELRGLLDEELNRLPERYRAPLILHYLEEKTVEQIAQELGWRPGTVCSRLARGKKLLGAGLASRGLTLSAAAATAVLASATASAAVPLPLARTTLQALFTRPASPPAASLAQEFLRAQLHNRLKWALALLLAVGMAAGGMGTIWTRVRPDDPDRAGAANADAPSVVEGPLRVDADGDPLPRGAILRLGSARFRPDDVILAMAYSPDGRTLVSAGRKAGIRTWDAATGRPRALFRYPALETTYCAAALSADGKVLAMEGVSEGPHGLKSIPFPVEVRIANLASDVPVRRLEVPGRNVRVRSVSFSRDGRYLAAGGESDTIMLWDVATGQVVRRFPGASWAVQIKAVALSPDGKLLVAITSEEHPGHWELPLGAFNQTLRLWDTTTGVKQPPPPLKANGITTLAFSTDGQVLAFGHVTGEISLWSPQTGRLIRILTSDDNKAPSGRIEAVSQVAFTADGNVLATIGGEGTVRLWKVKSGEMRVLQRGNGSAGWVSAILPDDRTLALAGNWQVGTEITLWDVMTGQRINVTRAPLTVSCYAAYSPDGKTLLTACSGDKVRFWDAQGRESRAAVDIDGGGLAVSPDGTMACAGGCLWNLATGQRLLRMRADYRTTTFSPDQRFLAAIDTTNQRIVSVWETATLRKLWDAKGTNAAEHQRVAFSVDSKTIAWGSGDGYVTLRDAATGKEFGRLRCHGPCWQVAFCPDGRILAAAGENYIQLWDLPSKRMVRQLEQAPSEFRRLAYWPGRRMAFSPDGTILAAAGVKNTICLWQVATGRQLPTLSGHWAPIVSLDFAPDGKTLVSGSDDTTALVWDLSTVAGKRDP
jgi:RNA polymerase sigma factor (sigma-70 family)